MKSKGTFQKDMTGGLEYLALVEEMPVARGTPASTDLGHTSHPTYPKSIQTTSWTAS